MVSITREVIEVIAKWPSKVRVASQSDLKIFSIRLTTALITCETKVSIVLRLRTQALTAHLLLFSHHDSEAMKWPKLIYAVRMQ